ncbi:MAG: undecaprenyl-diphosphate phosphatase [Desulfobacteraceae bacterium]|nr:undecaprenyl-diphosphate phosphatase [Desulfobacteraceae bacterium]
MEIYQGIILGILQGLTEFLPVSSSGHLVLGQIYFGITESVLAFDISVHMGTLLAIVIVFISDIKLLLAAAFKIMKSMGSFSSIKKLATTDENVRLLIFIIVASVPTAFMGLFLKQFHYFLFSSTVMVGMMLLVTGVILWVSKYFYDEDKEHKDFSIKTALILGISQGFAVIPGISRSGTTIAAGMFAGLDRKTAARVSFLISIPAILGAQLISLKDARTLLIDPSTIYGTIVSFITGLIALKILLKLVHAGKFHLFAPYCWLAGALVLLSKIL